MHCPHCDHPNADHAQFCAACGAALRPATMTATAAQVAPVLTPFVSPLVVPPAQPLTGRDTPLSVAGPVLPVQPPVTPSITQHINVSVQAAPVMPVIVLAQTAGGPGCLVRGLYFLVFGWWFSQLWLAVAWLLNLTILGLPLGLAMLNSLPQVVTLRAVKQQTNVTMQGGAVVIGQGNLAQHGLLMRALFFVLVGWWASLLWAEFAWLCALSLIGLPLAFWMFDRIPAITTLARR